VRETRIAYRVVNLKERDHSKDLDVGGTIILKCFLKGWEGVVTMQ
jgi:hypothetical protein